MPLLAPSWALQKQPPSNFADTEQQHNEQPAETPAMKGKFILDSAAHPIHIFHAPMALSKVFHLSIRTAANHTTLCTHAEVIEIPLSSKQLPSQVQCVATFSLHFKLLFVHYAAAQHGVVLFNPLLRLPLESLRWRQTFHCLYRTMAQRTLISSLFFLFLHSSSLWSAHNRQSLQNAREPPSSPPAHANTPKSQYYVKLPLSLLLVTTSLSSLPVLSDRRSPDKPHRQTS